MNKNVLGFCYITVQDRRANNTGQNKTKRQSKNKDAPANGSFPNLDNNNLEKNHIFGIVRTSAFTWSYPGYHTLDTISKF